MARRKRQGAVGTLRNLWRWTIYALAGVLLVAVYFNLSEEGGEEIAAAPQAAEETGSDPAGAAAVAEEEIEVADDPAAEAEKALEEAGAKAADAIETAREGAAAAVEAATEEAAGAIENAAEEAADAVAGAAASIAGALDDGTGPSGEGAEPRPDVMSEAGETAADMLTDIRLPGSEATYSLLNAFRRDDGALEITTVRREGESELYEIRVVTCAPLATGVLATGNSAEALGDARDDSVVPERIVLGSAESLVAATACGAFQ